MLVRSSRVASSISTQSRSFTALLRHNHVPSFKPLMTHFCELGRMVQIYKRAGSAERSFPTKPVLPVKSGLVALAGVYAYNPSYLALMTANPGYSALFIMMLFCIRKPCVISYEVQNMFLLENGVQIVVETRSGHWKLIEIQDISKIVKREFEMELHLQHEKPLLIRDRKEYKIQEELLNIVLKGNIVDMKRAGLGYHRFLFRRQECSHHSLLKEMKLKRVEYYELRWNWRTKSQFFQLLNQRKLRLRYTYYDFKDYIKKKAGVKKYKTPKEQEEEKRVEDANQKHRELVEELRKKYNFPIYSSKVFYSFFKITPQDLKDQLEGMNESQAEARIEELLEFPPRGRKIIKPLV